MVCGATLKQFYRQRSISTFAEKWRCFSYG
nr:MAG TPA: hypothetical protein [Caudoviricetes sp.]